MPDLTYGTAFNVGKAAPTFPYIQETRPGFTGWRPYNVDDLSNTEINVSGLNVTVSGIEDLLAAQEETNSILRAISGDLANANSPYLVVHSCDFVQSFLAYSGKCKVSKLNGISIGALNPSYLQVFDDIVPTGCPIANLLVESGNNFFYTFEGGVLFNNGITIASSATPLTQTSGANDFYVTAFYKPLS